eukprot:g4484.t1
MMQPTHEFASRHNPIFYARPAWIRVATCFSGVVFAPCYLAIAVSFWFGLDGARVPILCFVTAKIYALLFYHTMEYCGGGEGSPPPNHVAYWGAEAPYLLGVALVLHRLRAARPFSSNGNAIAAVNVNTGIGLHKKRQ